MQYLFETLMLIFFGLSWPVSVYKSYKARTAKGKSILFLAAVGTGYICGILSKVFSGNITYVIAMYVLNLILVSLDVGLYFRNRRLDRLEEK